MNIVGIAGSPTSPSRSTALLRAALASLARPQGPGTIEIEVRLLPAVPLLAADARDPLIAQALAQVAAADVVLVATPIYKAAYSGALKAFLDLLPQDGLRGKTVLALGTGGSIGHLLALDYALKPVLSALGARHVLDVVYAE
ncbi:NADPH-dependent FMN reductase, partial [Ideonella azotifigens]